MFKKFLAAYLLYLPFAFGVSAADKPAKFDIEKKQIEKEDAEQKAEREKGIRGKYQKMFFGRVKFFHETDSDVSPDVLGSFETSEIDKKPGRHYQIKVEGDDQNALMQTLKRLEGKNLQITGKLRLIGSDGEAKYLIVSSVDEIGPTPAIPERRSGNGL